MRGPKFIAACAVILAAGGCQQLVEFEDKALDAKAEAVHGALTWQCGQSEARRVEFSKMVDQKAEDAGLQHRTVAQDCNGDGQPDF